MRYINQDFQSATLHGRAFRKGKGDEPETLIQRDIMQAAQKGQFKPFSFTSTSTGTASGGPSGDFSSTATQPYQNIANIGLQGAQGLFGQIAGAASRQPGQLDFNFDPDALTQEYFNQQSQLLQPAFEQQRTQLANDLFGSGRMGLSLSGSAVGAGGQGMVNPDAFGLARAQSQTLSDVAAQSRERALADVSQRFGLAQNQLTTNEALRQQQYQNLLSGGAGLFGAATTVGDIERANFEAALAAEQARGASYINSATAMGSGIMQQGGDDGKGLGGAILGGIGQAAAGPIGGAIGSKVGGYIN